MKKLFPFLFALSVLLTWVGSNNRQLILDRNPLVFWIIFAFSLAFATFIVYHYYRDLILQKISGSNDRVGKGLIGLIILTCAFAFTYGIQTPLDSYIIGRARKSPETTVSCPVTFFRTTHKPDKRYLKYIYKDKKYRKFISMEEARKLNPGGKPYKGSIELATSPGPLGTTVIRSYEIRSLN